MGSKSTAVKRLMKELSDLRAENASEYTASPLDENIFEWHFTIRGPSDGGFAGGRYHGRIIFPLDYPFKPPNIAFLTPNGRFEVGKKICLSITDYHPEFWRPAWGIRLALIALISFMPTEGNGAIGALDYTENERQVFAKKSRNWKCDKCGVRNCEELPDESEVAVVTLVGDPEIKITSGPPSENSTNAADTTTLSETTVPLEPSGIQTPTTSNNTESVCSLPNQPTSPSSSFQRHPPPLPQTPQVLNHVRLVPVAQIAERKRAVDMMLAIVVLLLAYIFMKRNSNSYE